MQEAPGTCADNAENPAPVIGLVVVAVMGTWYRPLLFASIDPEAAEAGGVPVPPPLSSDPGTP